MCFWVQNILTKKWMQRSKKKNEPRTRTRGKKPKVDPNEKENIGSPDLFTIEYIDYLKTKSIILEQIIDEVTEKAEQKMRKMKN